MLEVIEYRGFRLQVGPVGKGWRAFIYSPDFTSALPDSPTNDSPTNLEQSRKDEIVAGEKDYRQALNVAVIATSNALKSNIRADFDPTSVCNGAVVASGTSDGTHSS
jgi:hypothetical protein